MGQRHQLFLIARVREAPKDPKKYRCVAAFHHQWCYGKSPLRCVSRFKLLSGVKANADLIQRDLDRYHLGLQRSSETPCPYISFLGGMAFSIDMERRTIDNIHHLPASMGSKDGDNNDGITVIDISTPTDPKYCFAGVVDFEEPIVEEWPAPMSASEYLWTYEPQDLDPLSCDWAQEEDSLNEAIIGRLASMPLLTLEVLAETWPHEYTVSAAMAASSSDGSNLNGAICRVSSPTPTPADSPNKIPLESVLESLRTSRHSVVDLSNRALSPEDLHDILGGLPPFTRLNVSRNPSIDKAALVQILQKHRVEWLNIDECGISVEDVIDLLISQAPLFRGVEAIIHPLFLSLENLLSWNIRSKIDQLGIPYTFQFRYNIRGHLTLPFFGIDQLVQALMDVANAHHDFEAFYYHDFTFPFMQNLFGCTTRSDGQPLGESALQMIPPQTRNEANRHEYCFILISGPNQFWDLAGEEPPITRSLRGCQHYYGILLPEGEKRFVDLAAFFDHLQGAGWPEPKNKENLTQVLEAFKKAELLEDVDGIMKWLDRAEAGKRRYDSI
ncbi:hypothetical protein NMY22_g2003 [Coprinellus aureogranulatus]|nr:hypothetical protein NMY22_g2003 [Coprinellus aureogranulatus]